MARSSPASGCPIWKEVLQGNPDADRSRSAKSAAGTRLTSCAARPNKKRAAGIKPTSPASTEPTAGIRPRAAEDTEGGTDAWSARRLRHHPAARLEHFAGGQLFVGGGRFYPRRVVVEKSACAQRAPDVDAVHEVVVPGRDAADVDRLALLGRDVDASATAIPSNKRNARGPSLAQSLPGSVAAAGRVSVAVSGGRSSGRRPVVTHDRAPAEGPELVALERQQVPGCARG